MRRKKVGYPSDLIPDLSVLLKEIETKLAPLQPQHARGALRRAKNKLARPFKEDDFKSVLTSLERLKSLFGLALQTDHL